MAENTPLRNLITGFLAFTVIIAGVMFLISNVVVINPSVVASDDLESINRTFNKLTEMEKNVESLKNQAISPGDTGNPIADFLATLFNTAWNGITSIFTLFGFAITMITSAGEMLGLSWWVTIGGSTLILLTMVFAVLSVVFNREF